MGKVSIVKIDNNIETAVKKAIDLIGGTEEIIPRGASVFIKPNLCIDMDWRSGATTNPWVVEAVVRLCWEAGSKDILIGDGPTIGLDTKRVFEATGYYELAKRLDVRLVDLNKDRVIEMEIPRAKKFKKIQVARSVAESDILINIPLLKTHIHTQISVSLKNLKGILPPSEKKRLHLIDLDQGIADINLIFTPHLILIDGIIGQEGLGPISGDPVEMNLIMAGRNPVSVDSVASIIMGYDPAEVKHLVYAYEAGLGSININEVDIKGEDIKRVAKGFRRPPTKISQEEGYPGINLIDGAACSGCIGGLVVALQRMKEKGELALIKNRYGAICVLIGPKAEAPKDFKGKLIAIGRCNRNVRVGEYIPGCPPQGFLIRDFFRKLVGLPYIYADPSSFGDATSR
ncbi:MAG: DUF362 domain-containing protein [bacterium]|nr:DUF362 domain-containing protein [bacterium]